MSGSQPMPGSTTLKYVMEKILSMIETGLYPIALSLLLPMFMFNLVHEKEERLREIMKMSGMKMTAYWTVNYIWFAVISLLTAIVFVLFGKFVLVTNFFEETNPWVLIVILFGWELSQVSLSFFFQCFFTKAKTAMCN